MALVALCAFSASVLLSGQGAGATIDEKRREAAEVADRLESLRTRAEQLAEDYNDAQVRLAELTEAVAATEAALATKQASFESVRSRMNDWAVRSYVEGSSMDPVLSVLSPTSEGSLVGAEGYTSVALGRDDRLGDELRQTGDDTAALATVLADQRTQAEQLAAEVEQARQAAETGAAEAEAELSKVQGELAQLVAEEEARRQREAAEAAQRELEAQLAEEAAAEAAAEAAGIEIDEPVADGGSVGSSSEPAPTPAPAPKRVPPPPSPGAQGAIDAAMSMLGVRYKWAGNSPEEGFDCSGLMQWAWGRAGKYLPHSSRAQYKALTKVDFSDIQPGDLVFFGSPIHHVGMYIGNGQMVHAPQSGDVVKVSSVHRRDMVGVGRP